MKKILIGTGMLTVIIGSFAFNKAPKTTGTTFYAVGTSNTDYAWVTVQPDQGNFSCTSGFTPACTVTSSLDLTTMPNEFPSGTDVKQGANSLYIAIN